MSLNILITKNIRILGERLSMNTAAAKPSQVSEAPPARTESQKSSTAKRILVVDDELMNIKFMSKVLSRACA